jgi:heme exporter protein D
MSVTSPDREQTLHRAWRDRIALGAVALAAATVSGVVNVHERLHRWAVRHEPYDPFRLLPVAVGLAVLTLAYLIVTRRRLRREVAIRREREDELTQALQEIEVLSGLLAMCASCKRIRGEDGRWEPVDVYLRRHDISVSHGICPGCVDRLYPEFVDTVTQPAPG